MTTTTFDEMIDVYKKTCRVLNSKYALPWCAYYAIWYCNPPENLYDLIEDPDCIEKIMRIGIENGIPVLDYYSEEIAFREAFNYIFER